MSQIAGKYQIVENHNYKELLIREGVPEDKATKVNNAKAVLTIKVDGKKIVLQEDEHGLHEDEASRVTELILDQETDKIVGAHKLKNFTKLNGNVLYVDIKKADGSLIGKGTYTFSDSGMELAYTSAKDNSTAKRIFKKI